MKLRDKISLITGGTSGIGLATALLFSKEGAKVAITGRSKERGRKAIDSLRRQGQDALFINADMSVEADVKRTIRETVNHFGGIDILFNNAGIFFAKDALETSEKEWDEMIDINLKSVFLCSKYAIPEMRKRGGGVIINNASVNGLVGSKKSAAYCASKGGVVLLTKAMALDHAHENIRINCICPGDIETDMMERFFQEQEDRGKALAAEIAFHPIGRLGKPDEVARAVLYLASDDSSFVTGSAMCIDGGWTAQ